MKPGQPPAELDAFASGRRLWIPVTGLVVMLSLVDSAQTYIGLVLQGRPASLERALLIGSSLWLPLGVLVWPTLWLARRVRFDQGTWRPIVIHLAAAAGFAVTLLVSASVLRIGLGLRTAAEFTTDISNRIMWLFGLDYFMYWAIVASYYSFHYYHLAHERELAALQLHATLTESRLETLRAQLNPHFLFNTLNAISVLAMQGEHGAVVRTIGRLGELLRVSLDSQLPQRVPLASELEFLDGYLDIQHVRFADRLAIERDVAPDTLRALVPSLILQPLVENAIVHGVAARSGPGRITIGTSRDNGTLRLSVCDTGPGFRPPSSSMIRTGIGLANTRERLTQLYGGDHRFECGAGPNGGAAVVVTIPFQEVVPTVVAEEEAAL